MVREPYLLPPGFEIDGQGKLTRQENRPTFFVATTQNAVHIIESEIKRTGTAPFHVTGLRWLPLKDNAVDALAAAARATGQPESELRVIEIRNTLRAVTDGVLAGNIIRTWGNQGPGIDVWETVPLLIH